MNQQSTKSTKKLYIQQQYNQTKLSKDLFTFRQASINLKTIDPQRIALYKQFQRNYPKYISQKKILYPIMDECLIQPDGSRFQIIKSSLNAEQLLQICAFINNFPVSQVFSEMSDTQGISTLNFTSFMKLIQQLFNEQYSLNQFVNAKDIFKYKQGFLTAKEIVKTKALEDKKDQKKEKKLKKGRQSLLDMVSNQERQQDLPQLNEQDLIDQIQFESVEDAHNRLFWNLLSELFATVQKKIMKLTANQKDNEDSFDLKDKNEAKQEDKLDLKDQLFQIDSISIQQRRQKFNQLLNQKKMKDLTKSQQKLISNRRRNKYEKGEKLNEMELIRFQKLFKLFVSSWWEIAYQAIKIPYIQSLFDQQQLQELELLLQEPQGCFDLTAKQRGNIILNLISGVVETDSFRSIVEFRQEMLSEIKSEIIQLEQSLNEINRQENNQQDNLRQQFRQKYKRYYQLDEFPTLWINGSLYLGEDVQNKQYFIFSNEIHKVYSCEKEKNEWFQYSVDDILKLENTYLNKNGVKERELCIKLKKLQVSEILGDDETLKLTQIPNDNQQDKQTQIDQKDRNFLSQIVKTLFDLERKLSQALMTRRQRWETIQNRRNFFQILNEKYEKKSKENVNQILKDFIFCFAKQIQNSQSITIRYDRLEDIQKKLISSDLKYIEKVLQKKDLQDETIYNDLVLFEIMEKHDVIARLENHQLVKTFIWRDSVGDKVQQMWTDYLKGAETLQSIYFCVNILNLVVEEFSYSVLNEGIKEDSEIRIYIQNVFTKEKDEKRARNISQIKNDAFLIE
ncbi:hypothetical protein pb186bvf_010587 [Paramecium bursaria]